jgi:hypothetical protein
LIDYTTGISDKKVAIDLLKRSKIILFISFQYIYFITIGCLFVAFLTFGFNLSFCDFIIFGIP